MKPWRSWIAAVLLPPGAAAALATPAGATNPLLETREERSWPND